MREVTIEHTVPFHDVDPLLVVWHGHYFKYFEYGREALMRAHGLDVPDLVALGLKMMVVESHCRHLRPLRHGERVLKDKIAGVIGHARTFSVFSCNAASRVLSLLCRRRRSRCLRARQSSPFGINDGLQRNAMGGQATLQRPG